LKKDESKVNEFVVSKLSDSRENLISFSVRFVIEICLEISEIKGKMLVNSN
jgi:hypothetical protein